MRKSYGHLNEDFLKLLFGRPEVVWNSMQENVLASQEVDVDFMLSFWKCIASRIQDDVIIHLVPALASIGRITLGVDDKIELLKLFPSSVVSEDLNGVGIFPQFYQFMKQSNKVTSKISPANLNFFSIGYE